MPNARHALYGLARAGDPWPGHRDDWASRESGGIRLSPPLGQKPLGQGISQTERAISFRNAMHEGVPVAGVQMPCWLLSNDAFFYTMDHHLTRTLLQ
jgi:hypothetical protein